MFYLIELTKKIDEDTVSKGIYSYEEKDLAIANFHTKLGSIMKNEDYHTEMVLVIDDKGVPYAREYFERKLPEPQPVLVEEEVVTPTPTVPTTEETDSTTNENTNTETEPTDKTQPTENTNSDENIDSDETTDGNETTDVE